MEILLNDLLISGVYIWIAAYLIKSAVNPWSYIAMAIAVFGFTAMGSFNILSKEIWMFPISLGGLFYLCLITK